MKYKKLIYLILLVVMITGQLCYGQQNQFQYQRPIENVNELWHKIILPDPLFEKAKKNLSDLRIIGINSSQDTIEVPYLINILSNQVKKKDVAFKLLNQSKKGNNYIFFLEIPTREEINKITLSFQEENFDWKVSVKGSQKPEDWYSIIEDYRIVSVKNKWTDYSFTTLIFPTSLYRYYKISIEAGSKPDLLSTHVEQERVIPGSYKTYNLKSVDIIEDKKQKATIVDVTLPFLVPVSYFKVNVNDDIDYYRPLKIQFLTDSTQSPQGWKYHYRTVYNGFLSSLEDNKFTISNTIASKFRLIIDNQDNAPLDLGQFDIKGSVYELIARFPKPASYFLVYGNVKARSPSYDLEKFKEKIPVNLVNLNLAAEQIIFHDEKVQAKPLFQSQLWLWGIMIVIIIVLGTFSLKMIKKVD